MPARLSVWIRRRSWATSSERSCSQCRPVSSPKLATFAAATSGAMAEACSSAQWWGSRPAGVVATSQADPTGGGVPSCTGRKGCRPVPSLLWVARLRFSSSTRVPPWVGSRSLLWPEKRAQLPGLFVERGSLGGPFLVGMKPAGARWRQPGHGQAAFKFSSPWASRARARPARVVCSRSA